MSGRPVAGSAGAGFKTGQRHKRRRRARRNNFTHDGSPDLLDLLPPDAEYDLGSDIFDIRFMPEPDPPRHSH